MRNIEFHLACNSERALELLQSGRAQFVQCNSRKYGIIIVEDNRFSLKRSDSLFVRFLSFNLKKSPFQNKLFRQAIDQAIDRERLVSDLSTYSVPATQPIPVFVFGYNPKIARIRESHESILRMLRESGWKERDRIPLHVRQPFGETAQLLKQQLQGYGIDLDVKVLEDDEFFEMRKKNEVLVYISRYGCTTGDASDLLEDLVHSPDREGLFRDVDLSQYSHPTVTTGGSEDLGKLIDHRRYGLQTVMSMLMDDLLMIPLYVEQDAYAIDRNLSWKPRYDSLILAQEVKAKDVIVQ
jgi:peptide/nickel transport system substrate-binding protein